MAERIVGQATNNGRRWKGEPQGSGVFVVIANAIDFRGKIINKKSTVMLIR